MKKNFFIHKIKPLLTNKTILILVTLLSVFSLISYIIQNDFESAISFFLLGFITFFFSKNMIIVLMVPLIFLSVLHFFVPATHFQEGLETIDNNNKKKPKNNKKEKENEKKIIEHAYKEKKEQTVPVIPSTEETEQDLTATTTDEPFTKQYNASGNKKKYNIDYGSTIEDAYDQLNQILGSDGIKRLTNDTQHLMKQQLQLAESMKEMGPMFQGMAPLMKQAQSLLGNIGAPGGAAPANQNLNNLSQLAEKFTKLPAVAS